MTLSCESASKGAVMQSARSECLSICATLATVVGVNSAARVACFSNSDRLTGRWGCRCLHISKALVRSPDRDEEARASPGGAAPSKTTTASHPACFNLQHFRKHAQHQSCYIPFEHKFHTYCSARCQSIHAGMPIVDNGAHSHG